MKPKANRLINEISVYLKQHAHNPIDWYPYGNEAFEKAQSNNLPIIISIGYSACHWCHVMEKETFSNSEIAEVMNNNFVCIKVDREELPDVDQVYLDAIVAINGNGGWPINCVALPNGKPFYGGTYFKPEQWKNVLLEIVSLYKNEYEKIVQLAENIYNHIDSNNIIANPKPIETLEVEVLIQNILQYIDFEHGGVKGQPKFPMPCLINLILRLFSSNNTEILKQAANIYLTNMALGGIFDQIGGGFSRYSVDKFWNVPHFEKMLYDNAQLISNYAFAYKIFGDNFYKSIANQCINFVKKELKSENPLYFSAIDADSEGEEGKYYVWEKTEIDEALGDYSDLVCRYYNVTEQGNFEGKNILIPIKNHDVFAQQNCLSSNELTSLLDSCNKILLSVREKRTRPVTDTKIITSWNAMFISSLIDSYIAFDEKKYLDQAIASAEFLLENFVKKNGEVIRVFTNEDSYITGCLDDYACSIDLFFNLFEITTDQKWLNTCVTIANYVIENFFDESKKLFWYSTSKNELLFARKIEIVDSVIPSSNAMINRILLKLGLILENDFYLKIYSEMQKIMNDKISTNPVYYAYWTETALIEQEGVKIVAVCGNNAVSTIRKISSKANRFTIYCGSQTESDMPYLKNKFVKDKTMIYLCTKGTCMAPTENINYILKLISNEQ